MRLMRLTEYRRIAFVGRRPSIAKLRAKIREIPGGTVLLGDYYVDLDKAENDLRAETAAEVSRLESDPRLSGLV